jgi:nicotinamide-nucleotide amidase
MANNSLEQEVGQLLLSLGITIAVAESCTGGLICHRLTNVSGSSDYLQMGVVAYSNRSKIELLGVAEQIINQAGAVSEACVRAMALGIKKLAGTDMGLSVSGIAGPTGGTPEKPVGTVHMAMAWNDHVQCWKFLFGGNRTEVKQQTSEEALLRIRDHLRALHSKA